MLSNLSQKFIEFAISTGVLNFGKFITKAGRISPYFFNTGLFNQGNTLSKVAEFYAQTLQISGLKYDMLFGPAYKGITLVSATAIALTAKGYNIPFSYNRKEIKDHGEGGIIIGAKLQGQVVIIDDVISAGISTYESVNIIRAAGAIPSGILIALDRMERLGQDHALSQYSAVQEISEITGIKIISICNVNDLLKYITYVNKNIELIQYKNAIATYRLRYCI